MTHKKNNSGIWMVVWIVAFVAIAYLISPEWSSVFAGWYKANRTTTNSISAPQGGGWGWCPMMRNFQKTKANAAPTNNIVETTTSYETVNVWHDEYALVPETVTLSAGKNYKLVITPTADGGGCMNNMTLPGLDNNVYPVKKGVPVTIVINNAKAGTYELVCWNMWMHQWTILVQ